MLLEKIIYMPFTIEIGIHHMDSFLAVRRNVSVYVFMIIKCTKLQNGSQYSVPYVALTASEQSYTHSSSRALIQTKIH